MQIRLGYKPDYTKLAAAIIAGELHQDITDFELLAEIVAQLEQSGIDKETVSFVRMQDYQSFNWVEINAALEHGIEVRGIHKQVTSQCSHLA